MRLAVVGAKGPATVEIIYTASNLLQKAQEALDAVDAVSSHARQNGDGQALILCTTMEQKVRGLLRKEYATQEHMRKESFEAVESTERKEGLENAVAALRRHVAAQQEVIDNYQRSLAFYEQADKSTSESPAQAPSKQDSNLILAQEKEILQLQREILAKNQELQEIRNTWAEPERARHLEAENARLQDVEARAEVAKSEGEALFRRTCNLDREGGALRAMVQALGAQLLEAKQGLLSSGQVDQPSGESLSMQHYVKATEKLRNSLVVDDTFSMDAYRLQATLAGAWRVAAVEDTRSSHPLHGRSKREWTVMLKRSRTHTRPRAAEIASAQTSAAL